MPENLQKLILGVLEFILILHGETKKWCRGRVVRQRSAKPRTAVRIRSTPLIKPVAARSGLFCFLPEENISPINFVILQAKNI